MNFDFHGLHFERLDGRIVLTDCLGFACCKDESKKKYFDFVELQIAGENHAVHGGAKLFESSEWNKLKYIAYSETADELEIVQASSLVSVATHFKVYEDTDTLRIWTHVTNISDKPITIEHISSFAFYGMGERGTDSVKNLYLYRFTNSHHVECQPIRSDFFSLGMFNGNGRSMKRICGVNTGSWSSKEELPQAIVEDAEKGRFLMFQIESDNSWYWEIGDNDHLLYLNLGGPNTTFNQWSKVIPPKGGFNSVKVALTAGESVNRVLADMTRYRRHIVRENRADKSLPVIFNEYMHLSWDNPDERRTRRVAPAAAEMGAKYYVVDCGWHDECDYADLYKKVGKWQPSARRFPSGIKQTVAYIKRLGMKAGLWIEPEIIGCECDEMEKYYGDDCFMYRNGKKIVQSNRKFLDFRKEKVRNYLSDVIARMVGYGIGYIKLDYNQDMGAGTERDSDSMGDGLMEHAEAYRSWVRAMTEKYPGVVFESCASGGLRMDYKTLSLFSVTSTSDQTDYRKYPYIAANVLSAVLPEQAGVWSYPVDVKGFDTFDAETTEEVNERVTEDQVIVNMVNSMLGRIHLASAVDLLDERKKALIKEGVDYYKSFVNAKKKSVPYLPRGFADFYKKQVVSGLVSGKKIYLAVWKLDKTASRFEIPVREYEVQKAEVVYPRSRPVAIGTEKHCLSFELPEPLTARFIEIDVL